ncbi:MAG TPA: prepilin-type N-terminal cleavage/methylation domain-containing protein [Candidatus Gastranaerophilales bacterium]|nr:prepilin-type N-terminal cleavage/methylation domain-containing protein [Candidatus Gastranaerophilales bacterium]
MKNRKGFTLLEVIVLIVILGVAALFVSPIFFSSPEQRQHATVRANVDIAYSAIAGRYALKTGATSEKVAIVTIEALNPTTKNPVNRKNPAFSINAVSPGTVVFVPDNERKLIQIKGYAKDIETPLKIKTVFAPEDHK